MFGLNWGMPNRLTFKNGFNVLRTHCIVFFLTAAIIDLAPFLVSKSAFLSATNIGREDNFIVDGTSYIWAVLFPVFIFCGLFSAQVRQRLTNSFRDSFLFIVFALPLILFSCLRLIFDPFSLPIILQVILPLLHLCSLWIWFVAFRPCFKFKIFINYLMFCLLLVVVLQTLSALTIIPGSYCECSQNAVLASADPEGEIRKIGPYNTALTSSRDYLRFFLEDGYIPLLKAEPGFDRNEVDLYQYPWLYVIDQYLHNKVVAFKGMAESGFLLCFATWIACILFWRRLSWPFWLIYPLCVLSAFLSSSRAGIWGSCIIVVFTLLASIWEKSRILALTTLAAFILTASIIMTHYQSIKTTYVVPTEALDYFNFSELRISSLPNLLSILDYSFYFRIAEFRNFLFERSFQEMFFGTSVAPEFSHSFGLTAATIFGLVGFGFLLLPLLVIFVIGMFRFKSVHVLTAAGIVFINFVIMDTLVPWLVAFPIFLVMLEKHEQSNLGRSMI